MATKDLAFIESQTLREQHVGRTEVLDKVKVLAFLPDGVHVTTEMIATYYEVPQKAVESAVFDHRGELDSDGYLIATGARLASLKEVCGIQSRARSIALFPKQAILRMGMLLRDSEVARSVRDYLLEAEKGAVEPKLTEIEAARRYLAALEREEAATARAVTAEAQVAELEPKAATLDAIESGKGMVPRSYRKSYFPDVPEREFFSHLYRRGFLINQSGTGSWDRRNQRYRDGAQHGHPGAAGNPFFYLHSELDRYEVRRYHARVRPGKPEIKLRDLLVRQGLTPKLITDADLERTNP